MNTLQRWEDGAALETDPRREDPLYYYVMSGDWASAFGFRVDPVGQESRTEAVSVSVTGAHRARFAALPGNDSAKILARVVQALAARFDRWTEIVLDAGVTPALESMLVSLLGRDSWSLRVDRDRVILSR